MHLLFFFFFFFFFLNGGMFYIPGLHSLMKDRWSEIDSVLLISIIEKILKLKEILSRKGY